MSQDDGPSESDTDQSILEVGREGQNERASLRSEQEEIEAARRIGREGGIKYEQRPSLPLSAPLESPLPALRRSDPSLASAAREYQIAMTMISQLLLPASSTYVEGLRRARVQRSNELLSWLPSDPRQMSRNRSEGEREERGRP